MVDQRVNRERGGTPHRHGQIGRRNGQRPEERSASFSAIMMAHIKDKTKQLNKQSFTMRSRASHAQGSDKNARKTPRGFCSLSRADQGFADMQKNHFQSRDGIIAHGYLRWGDVRILRYRAWRRRRIDSHFSGRLREYMPVFSGMSGRCCRVRSNGMVTGDRFILSQYPSYAPGMPPCADAAPFLTQ